MNEAEAKELLLAVFRQLRGRGFALGIGELLAAYQAVEGGWAAAGAEQLRRVARLLWCYSPQRVVDFEESYEAALATPLPSPNESRPQELRTESPSTSSSTEPLIERTAERAIPELTEPSGALAAFPMRTPWSPLVGESSEDLYTYWPLSRREMVYAWRHLRRPLKDGPRNVLNVAATVERTARQGFFLYPAYDRQENNRAHLLLLVDQGGSMMPFHRFTRDLVEAACEESTLQQVEVAYFHNVPASHVFQDAYLTEPCELEKRVMGITPESSVLVVSDAGAARGYLASPRLRATAEWLTVLKRRTTLLAWLNPLPRGRWAGTSAQFIARLLPMFPMDRDGFSNAVDVLRGQSPQPYR
jgi:uncharacterized protein with von Willebrand factor type A (vWA) domain